MAILFPENFNNRYCVQKLLHLCYESMTLMRKIKQCKLALLRLKVKRKFLISHLSLSPFPGGPAGMFRVCIRKERTGVSDAGRFAAVLRIWIRTVRHHFGGSRSISAKYKGLSNRYTISRKFQQPVPYTVQKLL
jgi:hypothetical protein